MRHLRSFILLSHGVELCETAPSCEWASGSFARLAQKTRWGRTSSRLSPGERGRGFGSGMAGVMGGAELLSKPTPPISPGGARFSTSTRRLPWAASLLPAEGRSDAVTSHGVNGHFPDWAARILLYISTLSFPFCQFPSIFPWGVSSGL